MKTLHKPTERVLLILETFSQRGWNDAFELSSKTDISREPFSRSSNPLQYRKYIGHDDRNRIYLWDLLRGSGQCHRRKRVLAETINSRNARGGHWNATTKFASSGILDDTLGTVC